jgi:hypothetical protein
MTFPPVKEAVRLSKDGNRLLIAAYGFEARALGWTNHQREQGDVLSAALLLRYKRPKGRNRIHEFRKVLAGLGISAPVDTVYDSRFSHTLEATLDAKLASVLIENEEVIVDISAMTKLLILVCLSKLTNFEGTVRIVYSEGEEYSPSEPEYEESKENMELIAKFPSRGFESIVRMKSLSSVRMQGQPVTMVAFTSFNEQLVRHMLGTINPHRLLFINGHPPRIDYTWRERATQEIHKKLIEEYTTDNPSDGETGLLTRTASTLDYRETTSRINEVYQQYSTHERIICAATGGKMQTLGLFFSKVAHPDIHIEYPTPNSYFVTGLSKGVRKVHEVVIPHFSEFLKAMAT